MAMSKRKEDCKGVSEPDDCLYHDGNAGVPVEEIFIITAVEEIFHGQGQVHRFHRPLEEEMFDGSQVHHVVRIPLPPETLRIRHRVFLVQETGADVSP